MVTKLQALRECESFSRRAGSPGFTAGKDAGRYKTGRFDFVQPRIGVGADQFVGVGEGNEFKVLHGSNLLKKAHGIPRCVSAFYANVNNKNNLIMRISIQQLVSCNCDFSN